MKSQQLTEAQEFSKDLNIFKLNSYSNFNKPVNPEYLLTENQMVLLGNKLLEYLKKQMDKVRNGEDPDLIPITLKKEIIQYREKPFKGKTPSETLKTKINRVFKP